MPGAPPKASVVASSFFFSSRRRHTRFDCDWSSDVCSSDLHYGIRWVAYLNDFSVAVHILGVALLIGALWLFAPKQPLSFLLQATSSSSMHEIGRASCRERV